ncbi:MAG: hypothetical protein RIT27_1512 [Pseudomonadota bacterium]|jgi:hypothetical protein
MNKELLKKISYTALLAVAAAMGAAKALGDFYFKQQLNQQVIKFSPSLSAHYETASIDFLLQGVIENLALQLPETEKLTAQKVTIKDLYRFVGQSFPEHWQLNAENLHYPFSNDLFIRANLQFQLQKKADQQFLSSTLQSEEWGIFQLQTTLKGQDPAQLQIVALEIDYKVGRIWRQLVSQLNGWFYQVESLPFPKEIKTPLLTFLKQPKNFKLILRPSSPLSPLKMISTPPEQWGLSVSFS